jgi:hypothetical protein
MWDAAKHPRGGHGHFGRSTSAKNLAGQKYRVGGGTGARARALRAAGTEHHNTMLVKKHVLQPHARTTPLKAGFRKARRVGGSGNENHMRQEAHRLLLQHKGTDARRRWMKAPR